MCAASDDVLGVYGDGAMFVITDVGRRCKLLGILFENLEYDDILLLQIRFGRGRNVVH